jgi:alpha-glucosidase
MQWNNDTNCGFSQSEPWIGISDNPHINVSNEEKDACSVLNYYRKLLSLRHNVTAFAKGSINFIDTGNANVLGYNRTYENNSYTVISNMSEKDVLLDKVFRYNKKIISNYADCNKDPIHSLRAFEAVVLFHF